MKRILMCAVVGLSGCGGSGGSGSDLALLSGCDAPAPFFITDVWPRYFVTYSCGAGGCHDASTGLGFFRLEDVTNIPAPAPTDPLSSWPSAWAANLRSVEADLSCANPTSSTVLTVPEGRSQPHPPGITVTDAASADALFQTWLQ